MMKKFKKQINNEKGLTLIELLAVIVILGIIAAIAVPSIGNIIQTQREKSVIADALMALSAADLYFAENPSEATVTVGAKVPATDKLIPSFLDDSGTLKTVTITKVLDGSGNTISFVGEAGKKALTSKEGLTKKRLNNEKVLTNGDVVITTPATK